MIRIFTLVVSTIALLFCNFKSNGQNVGIGTATPLDKLHVIGNIRSSTLAGAGSRMVLSDLNGTLINATGLTSPAWMTTGNTGTVAATNFLGTTDSVAFILKTFNIERMRALANGQISVNNIAPFINVVFSSYAGGAYDAIDGAASGTGDGVYGQNTSTGLTPGNGVTGIANTTTSMGVGGYSFNATGTGLIGVGNNIGGLYLTSGTGGAFTGNRIGAVSISTNVAVGTASTGILGRDAAGTFTTLFGGAGVTGTSAGSGVGVFAYNTGVANVSHGLYSQISSASAVAVLGIGGLSGVQGQTTVASGVGVAGFGGADGDGIYGTSTGALGYGVTGVVSNGLTAIGVYGYADANGAARYGGYFDNDLGSSGTKSFMIDHPLDPANKFLKHYSMESPEILNMYRGNVILNASGEAIVTLPAYFDAVNNNNYSYYLTPIGAPAQLYVKQEINDKQFVIGGGAAGMKVSWIVYTERNDPYLQQNPEERLVEVVKTGDQVGKYISPTLYGLPKESGLFYKNRQGLKAIKKEVQTEESSESMKKLGPKETAPVNSLENE